MGDPVLPIVLGMGVCRENARILIPFLAWGCLLVPVIPSVGVIPIALIFLTIIIVWLGMGSPHKVYLGLGVLLSLAFSAANGLIFFVMFEASIVPICILILLGGNREERVMAAAYMRLYTLVGGGLHVLGLISWYSVRGSLS